LNRKSALRTGLLGATELGFGSAEPACGQARLRSEAAEQAIATQRNRLLTVGAAERTRSQLLGGLLGC